MIIKTKNLILRPTQSNDEDLKNLFQDIETLSKMSEKNVRPVDTPAEIIFRIESDTKLIGEIRIKNIKWYNRKAQLSIMISDEYRNQGYGFESLVSIIDYIFFTMNFHRIEAEVIDSNQESVRLIEKSGFKPEGRLREAKFVDGKYHDILFYGLLRNEWQKK
ncbi:MAG: GNAT family N-acetyltransferase [Melioribacteraceae bacterium]|nr:GNAT family N-acetyltransferase [Melioribacteraceae bacterium]